ncbi:BAC clone 20-21 (fragment) [Xenorhabdus poinarii G6]|uniref:BAC clone 20-21 n=1 Tax=Xenorhabdus poinarii G6 TaxID=1354304 RepID=A0A068R585_9GAMM
MQIMQESANRIGLKLSVEENGLIINQAENSVEENSVKINELLNGKLPVDNLVAFYNTVERKKYIRCLPLITF